MTHNHHENLSMMDAVTTKYGRTSFVTVSKTLAIMLVVIFFICLIATGLLVYSFTSTCAGNGTELITNESIKIEDSESARVPLKCEHNHHDSLPVSSTLPPSTTTQPSTTSTASPVLKSEIIDIRLPRSILPESYVVHLVPFIQVNNFTFSGEVTILINVLESCNNITLHSVELNLRNIAVSNIKNQSVTIKNIETVEQKDFLVIILMDPLEKNQQYYINIEYNGVLNNMLEGFYRSSYVENNTTRWLAATQFQATDARKAFPCFDEPSMKARFQINLGRLKNMTSISNMRKLNTTEPVKGLPDYVWDSYEETVKMSTYLVAFVISDFRFIKSGEFSIWARPSALSQAEYSLEIGPKVLKYYEQFFGIKYPLPKIDMVAIPDFSAGAMENWGLITYREPALLYQKGVSSKASQQRIAHVVSHELAHQWFGNLVTPVWWEDIWLNEGFATYVEYLGSYAVNPKWKDLDLFLISDLHQAFTLDALKTSHPISVKVNNPDEVGDIFDRIAYSKGASVIRMMQHFLGEKLFQKGLNIYLKSRAYDNAAQDDLWETFTQQTVGTKVLPNNTTIKEIMDSWTLQTGYPVVTITRNSNGDLSIRQERFLLEAARQSLDKTLWWIPITILDDDDRTQAIWLENKRNITAEKVLKSDCKWFLGNVHQYGYYRVNYDIQNWQALVKRLQGNGHKLIPARNRAQIVDDALKLASAGYLSYDIALNTTLYLKYEKEYVPWKAALTNFEFLYNMFVRSAHFDKFKTYMLSIMTDFYKELTFKEIPNEDPTMVLNRMEIINLMCRLGHKECVLEAVLQFQNWRNSPNPDKENLINPDLRETVYCTAIADGGQEEWNFAWNRYLNTNVGADEEIILSALACSKEIWILSRYLEWSLTENLGIRKHDAVRVFAAVAENPIGQDLVYRFMKTNWKRIISYLGSSSMFFSSIIRTSTEKFTTEEEVNDFKSFFERKRDEFGVAVRTAQQSIEQVESNTRWRQKHFDTITKWLETAIKMNL
ncbi:suppressor of ER stress-induced death [Rhynchophorus ferrugineus]|uniref:suppressor of ER stress-induced death n=1 Tax=Rhynchophorus ferrugineus TaxID=354439 RepID=UPI003FCDEDC1